MIPNIYLRLSKYLYLNCASRFGTKLDYSIMFDSKFCADVYGTLYDNIQRIFYELMPKLYIVIDNNYIHKKYIPIKLNKIKNKLYIPKIHKPNSKMNKIVDKMNERISLINIYFSDKSSDILYDDSFYFIIDNLFNNLSNIEILELMLKGEEYED